MTDRPAVVHSGYVAVAGLVNSGKSALVNALTERDICPSHSYSGITRIPITSIFSDESNQVCIIDTPPLGVCDIGDLFDDIDLICLTLNSNELSAELNSPVIREFLAMTRGIPIVFVPTFIDYFPANLHGALRNQISMALSYHEIVPVCAPCGQGIGELRQIICDRVPGKVRLFPDECFSLHSERFLVSEQIRYSLFCALPPEIASSTAVQIEEFSIRDQKRYVRANLYVSRHSNKGVVIGKKGSMLQHISSVASESSARIIERSLYLDLWVKVRESWPENSMDLVEFGYIC